MNSKRFIILYLIVFIVFILLNVLGNIERKGYLSEFNASETDKYVFDNDSEYAYSFRIKYYNKIFRNNDIYSVYIQPRNLPYYIKKIKFSHSGSPFGKLLSTKELYYESKIDNISYKLKLKPIIYLCFILLLLIYPIYLSIKNRDRIKQFLSINNFKEFYKKYGIFLIFLFAILGILYFLGTRPHIGKIGDFELVYESNAGYVYRGKIIADGLFSANILYKILEKPLLIDDKPNYIKNYGYNIEIDRFPDAYDNSIATNWQNDDGGFTVSNSINWNAYNVYMLISPKEVYEISIEAKRIGGEGGAIFWHLDDYNSYKMIDGTSNISTEYSTFTDMREISKLKNKNNSSLYFYFPKGEIGIKSILIKYAGNDLISKGKNTVIVTSSKKLNYFDTIDNIKYSLKINFWIFILVIILLSLYILFLLINLLFFTKFIKNINFLFGKNMYYIFLISVFLLTIMIINKFFMFNGSYVRMGSYVVTFFIFLIFLAPLVILETRQKFFNKTFLDFYKLFIEDRIYIIVLFLACIITYGFTLTNFTYDGDDYVSLYGIGSYSALVQERISSFILKLIFDTDIFIFFWRDILGVIMIALGATLWTLYFYRMYGRKDLGFAKIIFPILFLSYPILTYFIIFSIYLTGLIYLMSGVSLLLFENIIRKPKIYNFVPILILVSFITSFYEVGLHFFVMGVVLGLLLYTLDDNNKHTLKEYISIFIMFVFICLFTLIFKSIISSILIAINGAVKSNYIERTGMIKWNFSNFGYNFEIIKSLFFPYHILLKYRLLNSSLIILFISLLLSIKKRRAFIFILGIISIYSSIMMIIITGNTSIYLRPLMGIASFIAFSFFFIMLTVNNKKCINICVFLLCIFVFLIQSRDTNYNFQNHYLRYELDKFMTFNIINEIQKQNGSTDSKPIYFSGKFEGYDKLKVDHKYYKDLVISNGIEVIGMSIYSIDFYGDVPGFFNFLGFPIRLMQDSTLISKAQNDSLMMPAYPYEGFVKTFDDYIVVKLSD